MQAGSLGLWFFTEGMSSPEAAEFAGRLESLGYSHLWLPETMGRDPFAHAAHLLSQTETLHLATGIANIYHRHPGMMVQAQKTLAEQSGGRFLLGIGVSHAPLVEGARGLHYGKPVATMRQYLEDMAAAPYSGPEPKEKPKTVLAALEQNEASGSDAVARLAEDLPLFAASRPKSAGSGGLEPTALEKALDELRPDDLSPREALDALYRLKNLAPDDE